MNLALLKLTDKELLIDSIMMNAHGKQARNEIKRRKAVGYCDGTAIVKVDAKAELVDSSRVGTITINGVVQ
jgi:hypothetical protein